MTTPNNTESIDVKNLCSRKLWELLAIECPKQINKQAKTHIEQELLTRQHYLKELNSRRQQTH